MQQKTDLLRQKRQSSKGSTGQIINIYCDGGARGNPGPAGIGFVVKNARGDLLHSHKEFIGRATNNVAEYQAVITALKWINRHWSKLPYSPDEINFFLDSVLVTNQLKGEFKIKNNTLRDLYGTADALRSKLNTKVIFISIPREKNHEPDALVNLVLDEHLGS